MMATTLKQKFFLAAREGNLNEVAACFSRDESLVTARDSRGHTALHFAAEKNHHKVVEWLIDKGANKDAKTNSGHTPLCLAVINAAITSAGSLLSREADPNIKTNQGVPPLHFAIDDFEMLQLLLSTRRTDSNIRDFNMNTALHIASDRSREQAIQLLKRSGASIYVRNKQGITPVGVAKNDKIRKLLKKNG